MYSLFKLMRKKGIPPVGFKCSGHNRGFASICSRISLKGQSHKLVHSSEAPSVHFNYILTICLYGAVPSGFEGGLSITRGILGPPPPKMPRVMDSPPLKPLSTVSFKEK